VLSDAGDTGGGAARTLHQQDLWHYTVARMVDACKRAGIAAFYGPFGDFADAAACEAQFRNAFLMGCAGAWTLHPSQVAIAKRVFSPAADEVAFARRILEAMPDGTGAVMIDGRPGSRPRSSSTSRGSSPPRTRDMRPTTGYRLIAVTAAGV
jgi:malyl-CoA/(S)-citramalyl-CoA lyase